MDVLLTVEIMTASCFWQWGTSFILFIYNSLISTICVFDKFTGANLLITNRHSRSSYARLPVLNHAAGWGLWSVFHVHSTRSVTWRWTMLSREVAGLITNVARGCLVDVAASRWDEVVWRKKLVPYAPVEFTLTLSLCYHLSLDLWERRTAPSAACVWKELVAPAWLSVQHRYVDK